MDIEKECSEAMARLQAWIDSEVTYHHKVTSYKFELARSEFDALHSPPMGFIKYPDLLGWPSTARLQVGGFGPTALEFRAPGNVVLYRDNPLYINVPEILAIWLRSTTLYRVARRIWVGEKAE